jgi:hypothetical protein
MTRDGSIHVAADEHLPDAGIESGPLGLPRPPPCREHALRPLHIKSPRAGASGPT